MNYFLYFLLFFALVVVLSSFVTVRQGTIAVVTIFGKYQRQLRPGLNFKVPLIEVIHSRISIQNRSVELSFQAVTQDQANVYFKAMLLYSVLNHDEETIKNVAFKFVDSTNLMQALIRTIEGSIRAYVATQKQANVLAQRNEIVEHVKQQIDKVLESWGYHLQDLQLNDITFDEEIMRSMSRVVASNNLKAAAENEGQALLITKTKGAEADGNAIKIAAAAEREAAQLRGQGIALFRAEVAHGMTKAAQEMEQANLDISVILFTMWTESIKHFAENSQGNTIFLDGSTDAMNKTMKELMSVQMQKLSDQKG
ncbi:SPFH domain-containing protein [Pedobacter nutrimenti]|jgi:regulator of protease activity HflC (stomatin/prohibitin superfamily)|uniref:Regulator of protease activity HflC (Stomatin/prohibitin superfamily) n=1 Tax=Pedobacter nutrimenti TaxID=1241337 RepID=A0A318UKE6_9SPHI|nr:SPFH domain-containing protein [Pedobacter nutrimenti]PYF75960.1 regulator of protease activity HflC (stomatin/prohibitin superfamily) [Pedobacter nutrimenti]|eukprot:gene13146-15454_t